MGVRREVPMISKPVIDMLYCTSYKYVAWPERKAAEDTHPLQAETSMLSNSDIEAMTHYKPKAGTVSTPAACVGRSSAWCLAAPGL